MTNPYQQPPQQGYGAYPQYPQQGAPVAAGRPPEVRNAFWLWLVAMVSSLVGVVVYMFLADETQRQMYQRLGARGAQLEGSPLVQETQEVSRIIGLVLFVVLVGVWLLFVLKMRAGRNWARITLLVLTCVWWALFVIDVLAAVTGLSPVTLPTATWVLSAITALASLAAVVLSYRGQARPYFAAPRVAAPYGR